jgi:hypothetical protein
MKSLCLVSTKWQTLSFFGSSSQHFWTSDVLIQVNLESYLPKGTSLKKSYCRGLKWTETWWEAPTCVWKVVLLSFLKAEWKASDTGSVSLCLEIVTWFLVYECIMMSYWFGSLHFVPVQWILAELWSLEFEIWPNI